MVGCYAQTRLYAAQLLLIVNRLLIAIFSYDTCTHQASPVCPGQRRPRTLWNTHHRRTDPSAGLHGTWSHLWHWHTRTTAQRQRQWQQHDASWWLTSSMMDWFPVCSDMILKLVVVKWNCWQKLNVDTVQICTDYILAIITANSQFYFIFIIYYSMSIQTHNIQQLCSSMYVRTYNCNTDT